MRGDREIQGSSALSQSSERMTLADPIVKERRDAAVAAAHVAPLNELVHRIRSAKGCTDCVPYFDPADGGVEAEVLFVLEAPGPKAVASGFVSCDNPDLTARNMTEILSEAKILRKQLVVWNIVPWYLGNGTKISPPTKAETGAGLVFLRQLLPLLPKLKAVVSVGLHSQQATKNLDLPATIQQFASYHPSPRYIHLHPDNRGRIVQAFSEVAAHLKQSKNSFEMHP